MDKLVSIVLPVYNGEKYLRESIDSVVNQTYQNWELLILDDCSTDSTPDIAKEYCDKDERIKYYRNETNLKLPNNLNRGFSLSKGDYLTWTSDDNRYLSNAIEKMVGVLKNSDAEFVFASCDMIDKSGNIIGIIEAPQNYQDAILGYNFIGACFMYTRYVYETIGGYNADRFLVEDYDYWLRIFSNFNVENINYVLYQYRYHDNSLSRTENKDRINRVCENVLLDNIHSFKELSYKQRYYYYKQLNNLRKTRLSSWERNNYKAISFIYSILFLMLYRIPKKIKTVL